MSGNPKGRSPEQEKTGKGLIDRSGASAVSWGRALIIDPGPPGLTRGEAAMKKRSARLLAIALILGGFALGLASGPMIFGRAILDGG